jgi:hypothetical protein
MKHIARTCLVVASLAVALPGAPARAQSNACVHLLVGAGYAARMRVVAGSFHTDWSGSFPIGKTKCQSLEGIGDGIAFSVQVKAILGKTKTCEPSQIKRVAASPSSVTFGASGTTQDVHCREPGVPRQVVGTAAKTGDPRPAESVDKAPGPGSEAGAGTSSPERPQAERQPASR